MKKKIENILTVLAVIVLAALVIWAATDTTPNYNDMTTAEYRQMVGEGKR